MKEEEKGASRQWKDEQRLAKELEKPASIIAR